MKNITTRLARTVAALLTVAALAGCTAEERGAVDGDTATGKATDAAQLTSARSADREYREVLQCRHDDGGDRDGICRVPLGCTAAGVDVGVTYAVLSRARSAGPDAPWQPAGTVCRRAQGPAEAPDSGPRAAEGASQGAARGAAEGVTED